MNRRSKQNQGDKVILWPDTFNNYFFPEILEEAQDFLEAAGFDVVIPTSHFCCGRALYDFGMLKKARSYLQKILTGLESPIQEDIPIVGMEPSCIAVFRNELGNLFPTDNNAKRLSKNFKTLPEFVLEHEDKFPFRSLDKSAVLQKHCHHNAVMGYEADLKVLKKAGVEVHTPDSGCCGLAGSFGFEKGEKYKLSVKAGERVILPRIREMEEDYVIADGFSCREQIKHGTGKLPRHTVQVLKEALAK